MSSNWVWVSSSDARAHALLLYTDTARRCLTVKSSTRDRLCNAVSAKSTSSQCPTRRKRYSRTWQVRRLTEERRRTNLPTEDSRTPALVAPTFCSKKHWSLVNAPADFFKLTLSCFVYRILPVSHELPSGKQRPPLQGQVPPHAWQWSEFQRLPNSRVEQAAGRVMTSGTFGVCVEQSSRPACRENVGNCLSQSLPLDRRDLTTLNGGFGHGCFVF